ncbi:TPA: hypothetical protein ACYSD8_003219 [Citrobacter freundii]
MITGFGNNVVSALAADITANQTTIQVMPGTGALFSGLLTYDYSNTSNSLQTYAKITLTDAKETVFEICHLTAVSNDILTVIRAQEGTTAKGWSLNDVIGNFATRGSENQFVQIEQLQSGHYISGVAGGTANALTLELPATYFVNGSTDWTLRTPIVVYPTQNNTGAATLQLAMGGRVLGTFKLYKGNKAELVANDILKDVALVCLLDNTKSFFNVSNPGAIYAGLGTAAFCDVTTSNTDTTPGRVTAVGWQGFGGYAIQTNDSEIQSGTVLASRIFSQGGGELDKRFGAYGCGLHIPYGTDGSGIQFSANLFIRPDGNLCIEWLIVNADGSINTQNKQILYGPLNKPTAVDVGAIPKDPIGTIGDNGTMASASTPGWWMVSVANPDTVADFPKYPNGNRLYSYGFMFVARSGDIWLQQYFSHTGASASRQTWNGDMSEHTPWVIDYSTSNKPTASDVGALPITGGTVNGNLGAIGSVQAGNSKKITLSSGNNSTQNATINLWGSEARPLVIEFMDDSGWHFYSQRNSDGSVTLSINGQVTPSNYGNFDARYQPRDNYATTEWVLQNFVQNIRVSAAQERKFWDGAGWSSNDSAFATAIWMVGGSSNVGGLLVRYVQKLINNTWYNVTE